MIPTTYLSLHLIRDIRASTFGSDHPIVLNIAGDHGELQLTIYLADDDGERSRAVVDALNAAMAIDLPPIPEDGSEAAAYAAAHLAYEYQGAAR